MREAFGWSMRPVGFLSEGAGWQGCDGKIKDFAIAPQARLREFLLTGLNVY